jgi:hypothetical protein
MLVAWITEGCIDNTEKIPVQVMAPLLQGRPYGLKQPI